MNRKINYKKNYLNLSLILFGVILLTIASSNLYKNHITNKINNSYISNYVANIQLNEIQNASLEFPPDKFIYVSYTGEKEIYNFEIKLRKTLKDNDQIDNLIYLDVTELMKDKDFLNKINKTIGLEKINIKKLPAIIYYKDNVLTEVIDSQYGLLNIGNFDQLLEKYEITN